MGLRADLSYDYRAARSAIAGAAPGSTGGDFVIGLSGLFGFLGFGPEGFRVVGILYFGQNISGPTWDVPIGQSLEFGMVLGMSGDATAFLGEVVGEANASNSPKLPLGDVLLLPAGFMADSDDGTIVNNRCVFAPVVPPPTGVPEPGTFVVHLALGTQRARAVGLHRHRVELAAGLADAVRRVDHASAIGTVPGRGARRAGAGVRHACAARLSGRPCRARSR